MCGSLKAHGEDLNRIGEGVNKEKLKRLIENLIEASKASTGNIHVEIKPCNLNVLLAQISGEYE